MEGFRLPARQRKAKVNSDKPKTSFASIFELTRPQYQKNSQDDGLNVSKAISEFLAVSKNNTPPPSLDKSNTFHSSSSNLLPKDSKNDSSFGRGSSSSSFPMDWSLKTSARFTSPNSFYWCNCLNPKDEFHGLQHFVNSEMNQCTEKTCQYRLETNEKGDKKMKKEERSVSKEERGAIEENGAKDKKVKEEEGDDEGERNEKKRKGSKKRIGKEISLCQSKRLKMKGKSQNDNDNENESDNDNGNDITAISTINNNDNEKIKMNIGGDEKKGIKNGDDDDDEEKEYGDSDSDDDDDDDEHIKDAHEDSEKNKEKERKNNVKKDEGDNDVGIKNAEKDDDDDDNNNNNWDSNDAKDESDNDDDGEKDKVYHLFQQSLLSWVHPLSKFPPSVVSHFLSFSEKKNSSEYPFFLERKNAWQEALRSVYYNLINGSCNVFYVHFEGFVVSFFGKKEKEKEKEKGKKKNDFYFAFVSNSTKGLRNELEKQNVEFSMPFFTQKKKKLFKNKSIHNNFIDKEMENDESGSRVKRKKEFRRIKEMNKMDDKNDNKNDNNNNDNNNDNKKDNDTNDENDDDKNSKGHNDDNDDNKVEIDASKDNYEKKKERKVDAKHEEEKEEEDGDDDDDDDDEIKEEIDRRFDNNSDSLLLFFGLNQIHSLFDFLINFRHFLNLFSNIDYPQIFSSSPFLHASIHSPKFSCRKHFRPKNAREENERGGKRRGEEKEKENEEEKESKTGSDHFLKPTRNFETVYVLEIQNCIICPWVLPKLCKTFAHSQNSDYQAHFKTDGLTIKFNEAFALSMQKIQNENNRKEREIKSNTKDDDDGDTAMLSENELKKMNGNESSGKEGEQKFQTVENAACNLNLFFEHFLEKRKSLELKSFEIQTVVCGKNSFRIQ